MVGYVPNHPEILVWAGLLLLVELITGFLITRLRSVPLARTAAWLLVVGAVAGIERLTAAEPAGVRMLTIIAALLLAMKVVVSVEQQQAPAGRLSALRWFAFATGWPGMRPKAFSKVFSTTKSRSGELLLRGLRNLVAGVLLFAMAWCVVWLPGAGAMSSARLWLATALLLAGISLVMHFGVFNLLAGGWRLAGADCQALFRAPFVSTSLAEFWGRRWNLAFSEMTALAIFRPLRGKLGVRAATILAFLFSGLLHELAISVPAQAGYGLPLLYFALHAVAMQVEAFLSARGRPMNASRWVGWIWTMGWVLLPLLILFHPAFLKGCVWPLIGLTADP